MEERHFLALSYKCHGLMTAISASCHIEQDVGTLIIIMIMKYYVIMGLHCKIPLLIILEDKE